jgi:hypothetical protein
VEQSIILSAGETELGKLLETGENNLHGQTNPKFILYGGHSLRCPDGFYEYKF